MHQLLQTRPVRPVRDGDYFKGIILSAEKWRTLTGYDDYAVSNHGRVRRETPKRGAVVGAILTPKHIHGGLYVNLPGLPQRYRPYGRSISGNISVGRLVAYAFHGVPTGPGYVVSYRDGDETNVDAANVYWRYRVDRRKDLNRVRTMARRLVQAQRELGD